MDPELFLTANVIGGWITQLAQNPGIGNMVPPAWKQEVDSPTPEGRPRGPVSLLIKKIRKLGWSPVSPWHWISAEGEPIDPSNGEQA
eukprot:11073309-Heterocapsa_arctica.AAC.1